MCLVSSVRLSSSLIYLSNPVLLLALVVCPISMRLGPSLKTHPILGIPRFVVVNSPVTRASTLLVLAEMTVGALARWRARWILPMCLLSRVPIWLTNGASVPLVLPVSLLILLVSPLSDLLIPDIDRNGPLLNLARQPTTYLLTWLESSRILTFPPCSSLRRGSSPVVVQSLVATQQTPLRFLPTWEMQLLRDMARVEELARAEVKCSSPVTVLRPVKLLVGFLPSIRLNRR